jgi:hypothetical protein
LAFRLQLKTYKAEFTEKICRINSLSLITERRGSKKFLIKTLESGFNKNRLDKKRRLSK